MSVLLAVVISFQSHLKVIHSPSLSIQTGPMGYWRSDQVTSFLMGTHHRLGDDSPIQSLYVDVISIIVGHVMR